MGSDVDCHVHVHMCGHASLYVLKSSKLSAGVSSLELLDIPLRLMSTGIDARFALASCLSTCTAEFEYSRAKMRSRTLSMRSVAGFVSIRRVYAVCLEFRRILISISSGRM